MSEEKIMKVPDIGGETNVDVIEVLVKVGDHIEVEQPLITLESDKASMEIPATQAGTVTAVSIKVGDKVSEGDEILKLQLEEEESENKSEEKQKEAQKDALADKTSKASAKSPSQESQVKIPDIGGATDVDVIEILVKVGDKVTKEQPLITLEGDKATMDIPSPEAGIVSAIRVKLGDKVSEGIEIMTLETTETSEVPAATTASEASADKPHELTENTAVAAEEKRNEVTLASESDSLVAAGPAVRRLAREFGVDLTQVKGSARKGRISKEDVQHYVKTQLSQKSNAGIALTAAPEIDFSRFGEIETQALNKIKRLTGENLHRAWVTIPHVTQFESADVTALEEFRKAQKKKAEAEGYKITLLAFVTKVVAKALATYPQFNASLDASGENLVLKKYFHIGIAVDTPNGLVVPVIRNVDQLSVKEIALEMARLSEKARNKKLTKEDMSGGCFTISSLGGIGGTAFTPVVNHPEVAILGLSRTSMQPVYDGRDFQPRLMLPLSLSYDHRVIDGAEAARFTKYLAEALSDIRQILL